MPKCKNCHWISNGICCYGESGHRGVFVLDGPGCRYWHLRKAIAIDFDGCICTDKYPKIGEPIQTTIKLAKQYQRQAGYGLILWTCREGQLLQEAVDACRSWGLEFDAINESLPEWIEEYGTRPRKVGASEYWDDRAVQMNAGNGNEDQEDQTSKYANMIESFECDFSLAAEQPDEYSLDDLQEKIEQSDKKMLADIELLKELSYGIRNGTLRIISNSKRGMQGSHGHENHGT